MAKREERAMTGEDYVRAEQIIAENRDGQTKKRSGICLCLSEESADLLRRVAAKMGVSQGSLREYLEGSQELKDAVIWGLKKRHEAWKLEAGEDLFPAVKEVSGG